jgi:hypothetical protein
MLVDLLAGFVNEVGRSIGHKGYRARPSCLGQKKQSHYQARQPNDMISHLLSLRCSL